MLKQCFQACESYLEKKLILQQKTKALAAEFGAALQIVRVWFWRSDHARRPKIFAERPRRSRPHLRKSKGEHPERWTKEPKKTSRILLQRPNMSALIL